MGMDKAPKCRPESMGPSRMRRMGILVVIGMLVMHPVGGDPPDHRPLHGHAPHHPEQPGDPPRRPEALMREKPMVAQSDSQSAHEVEADEQGKIHR